MVPLVALSIVRFAGGKIACQELVMICVSPFMQNRILSFRPEDERDA
jgi:hypothetical protein